MRGTLIIVVVCYKEEVGTGFVESRSERGTFHFVLCNAFAF